MADQPIMQVFDDSLHTVLAGARAAGPTAIDAESGAVIVLRYDDVERLAHDAHIAGIGLMLFDFMGIGDGDLRDWYGSLMFTNEGALHNRLRRLVARAFTPRSVEMHRAFAAGLARDRLASVVATGGGDLTAALETLPITVICRLLGVPDDEVDRFLVYGDALSPVFGLMDPDQIEAASAAVGGLMTDVDRMIGERSASRGDDLISALLEAEDSGDRLTHRELVTMVGNLIVGGHDTTASQIGCTLLTLLRNPSVAESVRAGEADVADVVNESIRLEPSIGVVPRALLETRVIGGEEYGAGTLAFLSTASANRQTDVWGDPDVMRPERFGAPEAPRLLTFGSGPHFCLGAALARMTLEETVTGFVAAGRFEPTIDVSAAAGIVEWKSVLGRSPTSLPVTVVA